MLDDIYRFTHQFPYRIIELETFLTFNRIWKQRLINVGTITKELAESYSFSGVLLRSTGRQWDLRKQIPYELYTQIDFGVPTGVYGDSYDRYLLRVEEMRESLRIMRYCIENIVEGPIKAEDNKISPPSRRVMKSSMEALIHHFKYYSEGFSPEPG